MDMVFPSYYPHFRCIAGACRHSCCIGWEIDIDTDTLHRYQQTEGALGERLRAQISLEDTPHFRLDAHERCPFLNGDGLCDLILTLGEDSLCHICAEHPRFYNFYEDRTEVGVGLCCEAAGRLILGEKAPVRLLREDGQAATESRDPLVALRDGVIVMLQERSLTVDKRLAQIREGTGVSAPDFSMPYWCRQLLKLERLEDAWTTRLTHLEACADALDTDAFLRYMGERTTEYEQFLTYFIYRHAANAEDVTTFCAWINLAELGYRLLCALGALQFRETGRFSFEDQVELARLFSAEIEYSEENIETLLSLVG